VGSTEHILNAIAQRMERDRQQQRKELARIARELRLLRAELRRGRERKHRVNGHSVKAEADAGALNRVS